MTERAGEDAVALILHELRTPLAIIAGYAELLEVRRDDATREEAARVIGEAAARLSRALDDIGATLKTAGTPRLERLAETLVLHRDSPSAKRVLIVDDDPTIRSLLRLTLPEDEYTVVEAADGREALRLFEEEPADFVLLDWNMPPPAGGELLAALRRTAPDVPLVVLTGSTDARASGEALEHGATAFLTKPFSPRQLLDVVEHLLARRSAA